MNGQRTVFNSTRNFSTIAIAFAIIISALFNQLISANNLNWQVVLAIFALAIGIPHGAVDHLVALPQTSKPKLAILIIGYVAIAAISVLAILHWNVLGFQLILLMSVLHFGFGDAAFISEKDRLDNREKMGFWTQIIFAITSGAVPVLIPLTKGATSSALNTINPKLVNWSQTFDTQLKFCIYLFLALAIIALINSKRHRELIDLIFLSGLAIVAPPLIAFAFYFGCWHAMRHTARLTLLIPKSKAAAANNLAKKSFEYAVIPGLPALIGTVLVALVIFLRDTSNIDASYLWYLLVVVWALTVPHMIVTSKIDREALA